MKKNLIVLLSVAVLASSIAAGCSNTATAQTADAEAAVAETQSESVKETAENGLRDAITVQVESVSGNKITAVVGELEEQDMPRPAAGQDGEMPEMPEGELPEIPFDQNGGWPEMPADGNAGMPMDGERPELPAGEEGETPASITAFVAGEQTITFELTDTTIVQVESFQGREDGTKEAVSSGAVLEVTLGADTVAETIVVKTFAGGGWPDGAPQSAGTET